MEDSVPFITRLLLHIVVHGKCLANSVFLLSYVVLHLIIFPFGIIQLEGMYPSDYYPVLVKISYSRACSRVCYYCFGAPVFVDTGTINERVMSKFF